MCRRLFFLLLACAAPAVAHAQTTIAPGPLAGSQTWTAAGSPYVLTGDVVVPVGATLTVEAGATVRLGPGDAQAAGLDAARTELVVEGTLVALGTTAAPITFTSGATTPATSDYYGIVLAAGSAVTIEQAVVERGHRCVDARGTNATLTDVDVVACDYGLYAVGGTATIVGGTSVGATTYGLFASAGADVSATGIDISGSGTHGVYVNDASLALNDSVVRTTGGDGLYYLNASGSITRSRIYENGNHGIHLRTNVAGTRNVLVDHNTVTDNAIAGIGAYEVGAGALVVSARNNISAWNGTYGMRRSGVSIDYRNNLVWNNPTNNTGLPGIDDVHENPLVVDHAARDFRPTSLSPARTHATDGSDIGAFAYDGAPTPDTQGHLHEDAVWSGTIDLVGDLTVDPGVTLTILPGTEIRVVPNADNVFAGLSVFRTELIVRGRLVADGTAQAPIVFHCNASANEDDWQGIRLTPESTNSVIENVEIAHAGYAIHWDAAPSTNSVRDVYVYDSLYGVFAEGGHVVVDGLRTFDASVFGVLVRNGAGTLSNILSYGGLSGLGVIGTTAAPTHVTVDHITIAENSSAALDIRRSSTGPVNVSLTNSIVANNGNWGVYVVGTPSLSMVNNDVFGHPNNYQNTTPGTGALSVDPQFVNAAAGDFRLLPTSPCIDAADPATAATRDLLGAFRPIDGDGDTVAVADLGAYEYNPSANVWPIADAGGDRIVTAGTAATFDGTGSYDTDGTIVGYAWDFGDGTTASGAIVAHTYVGGTDRIVTLTVTDDLGATDVETIAVEVNLPPVADAGPSWVANSGDVLTFDASGSSDPDGVIVAYAWDFGDGSTAFGQFATHTYVSAATYAVVLTVRDDDGGTGTATVSVVVVEPDSDPPLIAHVPIGGIVLDGTSVAVTATITDATGIATAELYYRTAGASVFTVAPMTSASAPVFEATIPGTAVSPPGVEYYIRATDSATSANVATSPPGAPAAVHTFAVRFPPPVITHVPIADGQTASQAVPVTASVTSDAPIASATLYYRATGAGAFASVAMTNVGGADWTAEIPAAVVTPLGVDYYLEAIDAAIPSGVSRDPAGAPIAYYDFTVVRVFEVMPGDLVISEVMNEPSGDPTQREWFELYNPTNAPIDIDGFTFSDLAADGFTVAGSVVVPAGGYLVLGRSADTAANGGVTVDYVYSGMALSDGDDAIVVTAGATEVDRVEYAAATFPNAAGAAKSLDPDRLDFTSNDDGASWCVATSTLAGGDFGTPGAANDPCLPPEDLDPPVLVHTPVADGQPVGVAVPVTATATDASDVASVELHYRARGAGAFEVVVLMNVGGDTFQGEVPAAAVTLAGVDYFLRAVDASAAQNEAFDPPTAPNAVYAFDVSATDEAGPSIAHDPVPDGQPSGVAVEIVAQIGDASGVASASLTYRTGSGAWTTVAMSETGDAYRAEIPAAAVTSEGVGYYLGALDTVGNASELPVDGEAAPFTFDVVPDDLDGPLITHTPIADGRPAGTAVAIVATVTDDSGVAEVRTYFRSAGAAAFESVVLAPEGDTYRGAIPATFVEVGAVDYYLEAFDGSADQNVSRAPEGAPQDVHTFTVAGGPPPVDDPGGCSCATERRARGGLVLLGIFVGLLALRDARERPAA